MTPRVLFGLVSRLLAVLLLALSASLAEAGPNSNGVLIFDDGPDLVGCEDLSSLCALVAESDPLSDCLEASGHFESEFTIGVWTLYAAFPPGANPRVRAATFGLSYDESTIVFQLESCADFELPTSDWPGSGSGTAITWLETQTSLLVPIYAFAGYEYYGLDTSLDITPHPAHGAFFADDSIPAILDPIAALGSFGFGNDPGFTPCPDGPPFGACCLPDGQCAYVMQSECDAVGGDYVGDDIPCEPGLCAPNPTVETSWGRIKEQYR